MSLPRLLSCSFLEYACGDVRCSAVIVERRHDQIGAGRRSHLHDKAGFGVAHTATTAALGAPRAPERHNSTRGLARSLGVRRAQRSMRQHQHHVIAPLPPAAVPNCAKCPPAVAFVTATRPASEGTFPFEPIDTLRLRSSWPRGAGHLAAHASSTVESRHLDASIDEGAVLDPEGDRPSDLVARSKPGHARLQQNGAATFSARPTLGVAEHHCMQA